MKISKKIIKIFINLKAYLRENRDLKSIMCYKCKKTVNNERNFLSKDHFNMANNAKEYKGIKLEEIEINDLEKRALFETGYSFLFNPKKIIEVLNRPKFEKLEKFHT
ncbi:hypothetical protein EQH57_0002 [Dictyocoela roeselum]|nr:hypothetical protein EQH57_0002 [Dictyocoela roeselum]